MKMKKILLISYVFFLGCATQQNLFFQPSVNGTDIYVLNTNYKLIKKFSTPILLSAKKLRIYKNKIYLFGVDQNKYYPALLIFNKNGKLIDKYEIHKKYALPKDFFVKNSNVYFIIDVYSNGKRMLLLSI